MSGSKPAARKRGREEHELYREGDTGMVLRVVRDYDPAWEKLGIGDKGVVYSLEITDDEVYSESTASIGVTPELLKEITTRLEALSEKW
jgi:hypothetical protein